jgi:hypothetical protein
MGFFCRACGPLHRRAREGGRTGMPDEGWISGFAGMTGGKGKAPYLILASLNKTCLRTTGSYFRNSIFSVKLRGFFLVT